MWQLAGAGVCISLLTYAANSRKPGGYHCHKATVKPPFTTARINAGGCLIQTATVRRQCCDEVISVNIFAHMYSYLNPPLIPTLNPGGIVNGTPDAPRGRRGSRLYTYTCSQGRLPKHTATRASWRQR
ncbi:hypothetical protein C8Q77DRAFT_868809 [Trametes polyzona]|nr:hypothetical protein C8Q77DRAFT_868809 [Trametes polyzona]